MASHDSEHDAAPGRTYAIGDVQGCLRSLQCLLEEIHFNKNKDRLWFVGDLVNRGPDSVGTLRFIRDLGDRASVVLGNHDLHLLAVASGAAKVGNKDNFDDVLDADDCDELCEWLRHQPLIHYDPKLDYVMVHAGLAPQWTVKKALKYADEVHQVLRGDNPQAFFKAMYGNQPNLWNKNITGLERLRLITNIFTRMRVVNSEGALDLNYKGGLKSLPADRMPWYDAPNREYGKQRIIFGHWASLLGDTQSGEAVIAIDTGCVWGQRLTAFCLEDQTRTACDCLTAIAPTS